MILQQKTKKQPNWAQIPYYLFKVLIIGGLGIEKTIELHNLIRHSPDIDKNKTSIVNSET